MTPMDLESMIEALIFASPRPMRVPEIADALTDRATREEIEACLAHMVTWWGERGGGFRLEEIGRLGYQFRTVADLAPLMEKQVANRPRPLSKASLETLAIIAFRQPVTRADIEFVRGVDAGSMIKSLLDRQLITCVGRREDLGRPMLFGTTDEFLKVFGLGSLRDLPPLESFQPPPELLASIRESADSAGESDEAALNATSTVPSEEQAAVDVESFVGDSATTSAEGV